MGSGQAYISIDRMLIKCSSRPEEKTSQIAPQYDRATASWLRAQVIF